MLCDELRARRLILARALDAARNLDIEIREMERRITEAETLPSNMRRLGSLPSASSRYAKGYLFSKRRVQRSNAQRNCGPSLNPAIKRRTIWHRSATTFGTGRPYLGKSEFRVSSSWSSFVPKLSNGAERTYSYKSWKMLSWFPFRTALRWKS